MGKENWETCYKVNALSKNGKCYLKVDLVQLEVYVENVKAITKKVFKSSIIYYAKRKDKI